MDHPIQSSRRWRFLTIATSVAVISALLISVPEAVAATGPSVVTQTFSYTGSTATFTVPAGITALTITVTGGEGGNGGADATPAPAAGGYRGVVTGTVAVTGNQVLTVGVGSGGATGASRVNASAAAATGGINPVGGYAGGSGGKAGANGSSGMGGAGGAASVITIGAANVVAGGGGGSGGSGQYASTQGHTATGTYLGRTDSISTTGQNGINANDACTATSCANNDGGGSGGGGGGAQGGAQGQIQFGAGTSNEWYGYGGSVGLNSTASLPGLTASYQYYSDNNAAGSVVISYTTGPPAAPTAVSGTAASNAVNLIWTAPTDTGQSVITDYLVRYSSNGGTTWSSPLDQGTTNTSGTVSGLTNGTAYVFQVAAVNAVGTGVYSAASSSVTPLGPPTAPVISVVTAQDGALGLTLSAPVSGAPVTGYDYRVNGGSWVAVASASTSMVIPGLVNGTSYTVEVRAESTVGVGSVSAPASGTPLAVPGAPTISSLAVSNGALTVEFTPGFNGGSAISSYAYQLNGGSWVPVSGTSSPIQITGLTAGTTYSVAVRAVNSVGSGASSAPASATTPALPGAPTISSATAGDGTARVSFAPGSTGGSPILGFEYQTTSAGTWTTVPGSSSPVLITGLTNGTTYSVRVRAINAVGTGSASTAASVTPATVPGAPAIVGDTVAGSDVTLSAAFTVPSSDGGAAITSYEYSTDAGATWRARTDGAGVDSPVVITTLSSDGTTSLTNGVTYSVELRAVNAVGAGTASAVATGISKSAPSAPTITTVTRSSGALAVSFTAGSNGGSAITAYEYSVDHGAHWVSTGTLGTSFVISDLTNGTTYPVEVRAINAAGTGAVSASVTGTPAGLPGQAAIGGVVRSDRTLTATVSVADNGGSPMTAWQYSTDGGTSWFTAPGTTSPLTLTVLSADGATRLANGTGYALQVRAKTAIGTGPASPTTIVAPASAPTAPSIAVTAGNTNASVSFALGTDGGSPVTQVEYSLDAGATWTSSGTLSSPFTISGLSNGTTYVVKLRADNAIGVGAPSVPTSTTPRTIPGAPGSVVAVSNTAAADVSWAAPADTGGAPITGYTASAYTTSTGTTPVSTCTTSGATSCSIPGLTNSTAYYVAVAATNAAGTGASSSPRVLVTPLARPGAPTLNPLTVGDGSITAPFTAGTPGDATITGYQYSVDGGTTWLAASGTSSPIVITGLNNGTLYTVALRALSSAGVGLTSNTRQGTPYTYPSAPDTAAIVANGGNGQITVSWAAANLNGGILSGYTATAFTGLVSGSTAATCTTTTLSCVITGLTNGTTYYVSLQTQNSALMYSVRSAPRVPATPSMQPGAPTSVVATAGNGTATVSWTAPMSTGASSITGYTVWCSANSGAYTSCGTATGTSAVITGLTNGSSYTFEVFATNTSGTGPASAASGSVTPLAPGTVPVLAAATSTVNGFTSTITNYDAAATYSATASTGATVVVSGSGITVTGLAAGGSAAVTVSAAKAGYATTQASVSGSALLAGTTPLFGTPTRTADGFTFTITNFDAGSSYALARTNGTVTISGSTVTVTGLAPGTGSLVTVTLSHAGYADVAAAQSGTALGAGTAPVFSAATPLAGGYRFTIVNYDAASTYTVVQADGASATRVGDTVTVSGLAAGVTSHTTVTAARAGFADASASEAGTSLPNGTAPVASSVTRTVDGFSFTIVRVPGTSYTVTSDAGTVVLSGSTVTVSGLGAGATTTVHITASRVDALDATTSVTSAALLAGVVPLFGAPTRTADGFTFTITNFDADSSYVLAATTGTATMVGSTVTVTGLAHDAASTVTVTVSHADHADAVAAQSGSALGAGTVPVFSAATPMAGGYRFTITNYDAAQTYTLVQADGGTATRDGDTVTVSGLGADVTSQTTVTVASPGQVDVSATQTGTSFPNGTAPEASAVTRTADGFTFTITVVPGTSYVVTSDAGTVVLSGSTVTVSGLAAGEATSVHITASTAGALDATTNLPGTALLTGVVPLFGAPTRTPDGYTFTVTNFDADASYALSATGGTATMSGSTVTVTGLAPGAGSTATVTASHTGYVDAAAAQSGTALLAGVVPLFGTPTRTVDGFTFTVTNFDADASYVLAATDGSVTMSGAIVTVTGLTPAAASTVTVTVSQTAHADATAAQSSSALLTGVTPLFGAPTRTADGYTFTVTNFDAGSSYVLVATDGTATLSGSTATVTGLAPGAGSLVTVTVSLADHADAAAAESGTALGTGTTPTFSAATPLDGGYRFTITNYDPAQSYAFVQAGGATVTRNGDTLTVSGLAAGVTSVTTVTVSNTGYVDASATETGSSLPNGQAPVTSAVTRTGDGFSFTITLVPGTSYLVTSGAGTVTLSGSTVTVTGLPAGASTTVHVTASTPDALDASTDISESALLAGVPPVFSPTTGTPDGYSFTVTNFDASASYALAASAGSATLWGSTVTVTGLAPSAASTVTVTVSHAGWTESSAAQAGNALGTGTAPVFSVSRPLDGGYRFTITNYDPTETYTLTQADGATATRDGDTVTVSGLAAGASSQTTVTVSRAGQVDSSATRTGTSLPHGVAPVASTATSTADGFTFTINVTPGTSYSVTSDQGTVVLVGSTVIVSGLPAGATTTVHVTASTPDTLDATTAVSGSVLLAGVTPRLSSPAATAGGFVVTITNYSAEFSYEVSTTAGMVTRDVNVITVTGLGPSAWAVVQVVATRDGYVPAGASATGQSLAPAPTATSAPTVGPVTSNPTSTPTTTPAQTSTGGSSTQSASAPTPLQESKPGTAAVTADGKTLSSTLTSSGGTVKVDAHNGLTLTVAAEQNGSTLPLGVDGVVEVGSEGQLWVTVTGFGPQSAVSFWSFGDASQLAATQTDATGAAATSIVVPADLAPGAHTLVVTGIDAQGKTVTMQVAIRVMDTHAASAGFTGWIWWLAALLVVVLVCWWFLVARRRRRDEEQTA